VRESGFLARILRAPDGYERIRALESFFLELARAVPGHREYGLDAALRHIAILERYGVSLRSSGGAVGPPGVALLTAHKAKGLEFSHVFIVRAVDGRWGGRRVVQHFARSPLLERANAKDEQSLGSEELHDERRLFYVALTRARDRATITHARAGEDGRALMPSRFIEEISESHRRSTVIESESAEALERERLALFGSAGAPRAVPSQTDRGFLRERFLAQGLSVTAINNYLACPWRYFFENLIRIPKAPNRHQLYGIAVHSALKYFADQLKGGTRLSEDDFLSSFERFLARTPLSESDFSLSREKGRVSLAGYYRTYLTSEEAPLWAEMRIGGVSFGGVELERSAGESAERVPPIVLSGVLDRVTALEGSSDRLVVTDYKTGRPRSRNDIEGKTKTSRGEYKRQLVFYKLLLERSREGRYRMALGELDFVEPDARGRYHRERFEVSAEDLAVLEEETRGVIREIWTLAFWNRLCGERDCEYCALRGLVGERPSRGA
jgi:DNA helicase-2/ATP-dependent DNA helicase PcrA